MSRTPLPNQPHELAEALRVHHNERNEIDHLTLNLKTEAQQLGSMIGAQPDDHDYNSQSWRFIEVPNKFTSGLPLSTMGKRLRSEMCLQLAGLETRWNAWDKAWTSRSIQLERRGTHFGQLTTIEVKLFRFKLFIWCFYWRTFEKYSHRSRYLTLYIYTLHWLQWTSISSLPA